MQKLIIELSQRRSAGLLQRYGRMANLMARSSLSMGILKRVLMMEMMQLQLKI